MDQTRSESNVIALLHNATVHFQMQPIALKWSKTITSGRAWAGRRLIRIGPKAWRSVLASLTHEFAHILAWDLYNRSDHRDPFFTSLIMSIGYFYGGNANKYPWDSEYKHLQAKARKAGLVK